MSPISADEKQGAASVDIHIEAHDNRGALEALYLELREVTKRKGLKIELRLDKTKPEDPPAR